MSLSTTPGGVAAFHPCTRIHRARECAAFAQTLRLAIQCNRTREKIIRGKRHVARLSELLRRAESTPSSSQALDRALSQMGHAVRGGNNSIARLEGLITNLTERFRPDNETLSVL